MAYDTRSKNPKDFATSADVVKLGNDLNNILSAMRNDILEIRDVLIKNLIEENSKLKKKVSSLEDRVCILEDNIAVQDLYVRRNNIELTGIPEEITQEALEDHVIGVFKKIDVNVSQGDIEACHRLKGKASPRKTIVRFTNRKHCFQIMKNRKKLQKNVYANANLNRYYHTIAFNCRLLKRNKLIHSTWYDSTGVSIKLTESSMSKKIFNLGDLHDLFPEFNFADTGRD